MFSERTKTVSNVSSEMPYLTLLLVGTDALSIVVYHSQSTTCTCTKHGPYMLISMVDNHNLHAHVDDKSGLVFLGIRKQPHDHVHIGS